MKPQLIKNWQEFDLYSGGFKYYDSDYNLITPPEDCIVKIYEKFFSNAIEQYKTYKILNVDSIDPEFKSHIGCPTVCLYGIEPNDCYDKYVIQVIYKNGGISLDKYLKDYGKKISLIDILSKIETLMEFIKNLHSNHIIHNDIKPENILVDNEENFRLIDFDISYNSLPQNILEKELFDGGIDLYKREYYEYWSNCTNTVIYCALKMKQREYGDIRLKTMEKIFKENLAKCLITKDEYKNIINKVREKDYDYFDKVFTEDIMELLMFSVDLYSLLLLVREIFTSKKMKIKVEDMKKFALFYENMTKLLSYENITTTETNITEDFVSNFSLLKEAILEDL